MNPRGFFCRVCLPSVGSLVQFKVQWVGVGSWRKSSSTSQKEIYWSPLWLGPHRGLEPTAAWTSPWPGPHSGLDPTVAWTHSGLDAPWSGPHSGLDPQGPGPEGWSRWCGVGDNCLGSTCMSHLKSTVPGPQAAGTILLSELCSIWSVHGPASIPFPIRHLHPVPSSISSLSTCWTPHTFLCSCVYLSSL